MEANGGPSSTRGFRGWIRPVLFLVLAAVFWVLFLGQAEESVFGRVPILDEVYYLDRAAAWTRGPVPPPEPFFVSPLYPVLISSVGGGGEAPDVRVFPPERLRGVRVFQIISWFGVAILLRLIAGRYFGRQKNPGWRLEFFLWLPTILFALYRPAAVYTVSILLELPLLFLMTAAIYLLIRIKDESKPRVILFLVVGIGATIGLAGLLRGTALLMAIPAMAVVVRRRESRGARWLHPLLLLATTAAILTPAVIHNSSIAGRLTGPTHNGGVNLYIGNGPEANGFYVAVVPGDWRRDPAGRVFLGETMGTSTPSLADADQIWGREAFRNMAENAPRTFGLWLKKVWLHLQGWEIDQLTPLAGWRRAAPALNWLPVPFALLVILGAAGVAGRWRDSNIQLVLGVAGVLVAGQSVFFVVSRYRLALVPLLCLLGAVGLAEIIRGNRKAVIGSFIAVLVTVPWGLGDTRDLWRAQAQANEARRWAEIGMNTDTAAELLKAEALYREALAGLSGTDGGPAPWLGLASLLRERGERTEAAEILTKGAHSTTRNLEINKALLAIRLEEGNRDEALALSRAILDGHPRDADTLHNRTVLLFETGGAAEAVNTARTLIAAHPRDPRGYVDLGIILARQGDRSGARAVFEEGLRVVPENPALKKNLEILIR